MNIPPEIAADPKRRAEFERGYYDAMRCIAHARLERDYGPAALSRLPEGDERGKPPPGPEAMTWPHKRVGWHPLDLFRDAPEFLV